MIRLWLLAFEPWHDMRGFWNLESVSSASVPDGVPERNTLQTLTSRSTTPVSVRLASLTDSWEFARAKECRGFFGRLEVSWAEMLIADSNRSDGERAISARALEERASRTVV